MIGIAFVTVLDNISLLWVHRPILTNHIRAIHFRKQKHIETHSEILRSPIQKRWIPPHHFTKTCMTYHQSITT